MALPSISTPEYTTKIPSTGQLISYRPFLVKEEKILLMAMEGKDETEIESSIVNLLNSCILTEKVDVSKLATFDIEHLFLQLRAKSIGEVIEVKVGHTDDNNPCDHKTDVSIPIDAVTVVGGDVDKKIMITDEIGVVMKYPTISDVRGLNLQDSTAMMKMVAACIDYVFDSESVYSDFTDEEMIEWIEGLDQSQFSRMGEFLSAIPKLSYTIDWTCKKCKEKDSVTIEGLQSFFTLV
jgi:hypothetical protein